MLKRRRPRSDSIDSALALTSSAATGAPAPPPWVRLSPRARRVFDSIVKARIEPDWTELDLASAAQLARTIVEVERLQAEREALDAASREGKVLLRLEDMLVRRQARLHRFLLLDGAAQRSRRPRRAELWRAAAAAHDARERIEAAEQDADGLLALPVTPKLKH